MPSVDRQCVRSPIVSELIVCITAQIIEGSIAATMVMTTSAVEFGTIPPLQSPAVLQLPVVSIQL
jgi:hypothetical protein